MINPITFIKAIINGLKEPQEPNWYIKNKAKKSITHPLAGFWKINKKHDHGIAIGPAGENLYYISFCGPGGCFKENSYRPNSTIITDKNYKVIDENTIEILTKKGISTYERC